MRWLDVAAEFHMLHGLLQRDHPLLLVGVEQSLTRHKMEPASSISAGTKHCSNDQTLFQHDSTMAAQ